MGTTLGCKDVFELKESGNSRIILDKIKNGIWIFFPEQFYMECFFQELFRNVLEFRNTVPGISDYRGDV